MRVHQNALLHIQELRRHIAYMRAAGKPTIALIERGGEREYYTASACAQVFALPCAQLVLTGFAMAGTRTTAVFATVCICAPCSTYGQHDRRKQVP